MTLKNKEDCKVCENCRFYKENTYIYFSPYVFSNICTAAPTIRIDPVCGVKSTYHDCDERNKGLECIWFEKKVEELEKAVEEAIDKAWPLEKKSWWTRMFEWVHEEK